MEQFSKMIREKKEQDVKILNNASKSVYHSLGQAEYLQYEDESQIECVQELMKICHYFEATIPVFPRGMTDSELLMQFLMSETGIMRRKVVLNGTWWKDGSTPLLCSDREGKPYALIPVGKGGYVCYDDGKEVKITKHNAKQFENICYCFYQPLPGMTLTIKEFVGFMCRSFGLFDVAWVLSVSILAGLLGMIMPAINRFIFHEVIPSGTSKEIFGISVLILGTVLVHAFCNLASKIWVLRIGNKMELNVKNAIWARVLSLPTTFFKKYSSGDLNQRASAVNDICDILSGRLIPTVLSSVCSFVYLFQINSISPELLAPSFVIVMLSLLINVVTALLQVKQMTHNNQIEGELSGVVFQLLNGLAKIKVAGVQVRAFDKWADIYSKLKIMPNKFVLISQALSNMVMFGGTIILYIMAYYANMSASDYIAFQSAFSLFLVALMSMMNITSEVAALKPAFMMLKPILEEPVENDGYKKQITSLTGGIELNQVKFRYHNDMPYVLDGLELDIKPGEYLGITGSSGCGKSTLMRILLGFEKAQSGSVYYDMQDINGLDLRSLRRRIGVVLQNGKLFSGDIYSNIVICAPWLSVDDAWEAAERAGFAEDIENMPMGMFTMISEGGGGLSGGQQQRLLIARALASDPDIIMFDEATSALDNITQSIVVKTLEEMTCTRLVIAHRLSTIQKCSRIIYLDKGKIIESGTYEELMELDGEFAQMAKRQLA